MIDLKNMLHEAGYEVVHIKTDSVKIPNATPEVIQLVTEFGKKYGYDFEHEATYDVLCLVNDAVYIAREGKPSRGEAKWTAVGAQFQHPYVFKTLFAGGDITFDDLCETKQVTKGAMFLDFENREAPTADQMQFVGRTGRFTPVTPESGLGGTLYRVDEDRRHAVSGTKGYLWMEAALAKYQWPDIKDSIDMSYFDALVEKAENEIDKYGPLSILLNG